MEFRYPGFVRGSLFLTVFFATVIGLTAPAIAQLTRLDSMLANVLREECTHDTAINLHTESCRIIADSGYLELLNLVAKPAVAGAPSFVLDRLSATVQDSGIHSWMNVVMSGRLVPASGLATMYRTRSIHRAVVLTPVDRMVLETNSSRYVHLDQAHHQSFWESTLEPALVVLGAAVIVALFFLIRS